MFTGIIEETGTVLSIRQTSAGAEIEIKCSKVLEDVSLGDSIAINGVCQTVVSFDKNSFKVDASPETLKCTNFKSLKPSEKVNLERAMSQNSRFGGHIVYGHVDTTADFQRKTTDGNSDVYYFSFKGGIAKYLAKKGSVCIDGISLTIADIEGGAFSVYVIPHTSENTTLKYLKNGDKVNIEADIIARYVENFISQKEEKITYEFLKENGF